MVLIFWIVIFFTSTGVSFLYERDINLKIIGEYNIFTVCLSTSMVLDHEAPCFAVF